MEEQIKEHFEKFQNGLMSAFDTGSKMAEPAMRGNEVVVDSVAQLVKDQVAFSRSCLDIGFRQVETLATDKDAAALWGDSNAPADYYKAVTQYGEALRRNAGNTGERLIGIGRETLDSASAADA